MQAIGVDCALEDNRSEDDIIHTVLWTICDDTMGIVSYTICLSMQYFKL
jgi:hypothetical protein